jgi:hypothetical protein
LDFRNWSTSPTAIFRCASATGCVFCGLMSRNSSV